ncbi:V-type proton ATPase subunit C [Golovinomyces cichoracearum]|uniref:V-type proton ATPase subunit C n=1 Tax=Golovinomyces cichoracearum TaxID=62708 RepID=A0A420I850_9PEZI|nr:V-type proton ATPase subunit C [Golovinomyces cichoracearum]
MSSTKFLLVSLPTSIASNDADEAFSVLRSTVAGENVAVVPFKVPDFKVATLDTLVRQADELAKLESNCGAVVTKIGESLRSLLGGDEDKILQQKTVNNKPADQYLKSFSWNKHKYRTDKPLIEIIDSLRKEILSIDSDVKSKVSQYNQVKTTLSTLIRKQTGNLSTKSLTSVVDPSVLIKDSENLENHLIAVPNNDKKGFLQSYETLSPMVVPRSATEIAQDKEFTLFTVVTFKKHSAEFQSKCREMKWIPREYTYVAGGTEEEEKELEQARKNERKILEDTLRGSRIGWGDSVMIWIHVLMLRVFVESILRYGLPPDFVCGLIKTNPKSAKKAKTALDSAFSYLGGNAFLRDKKGKVTKDDSALSSEIAAAGVSNLGEGDEYTAYVYYNFEIV